MKSGKFIKTVGRVFALFGVAVMISSVMPAQTKAAENGGMYAGQQESVDSSKDIECTKLVLDSEAVEVLRQDYLQKLKEMYPNEASVQNWTVTDILIEQYCGTYDGNEVVVMSAKGLAGMAVQTKVQIGEHEFVFANSSMANSFYVHKNHEFIPVKDAYEDKLLNAGDLAEIAKIFGTVYAYQFTLEYEDVLVTDWFYPYAYAMCKSGIMTGLDERTFGADKPLARAQFMVVLHRIEGEPQATMIPKNHWPDVADDWYTNAIYWGFQHEIMLGYTDSEYWGVADNITREQLATVMYRYAEYKGYDLTATADLDKFEDADQVSVFAEKAMKWAVGAGIIEGKEDGTKLDPQGETIRAECAAVIQRFLEKNGK